MLLLNSKCSFRGVARSKVGPESPSLPPPPLPHPPQLPVLEQGTCGHLPTPELVGHCLRHWLTMGLDVVLPIPPLLDAVDAALAAVLARRGLPLPPRDAAGAFVGSDSGSSERRSNVTAQSSDDGSSGSRSRAGPDGSPACSGGGWPLWLYALPVAVVLALADSRWRRHALLKLQKRRAT